MLNESRTLRLRRMGDFYEFFGDDAVIAAHVLGLRITTRSKPGEDYVAMISIPFHQLYTCLGKLESEGFEVTIVDDIKI